MIKLDEKTMIKLGEKTKINKEQSITIYGDGIVIYNYCDTGMTSETILYTQFEEQTEVRKFVTRQDFYVIDSNGNEELISNDITVEETTNINITYNDKKYGYYYQDLEVTVNDDIKLNIKLAIDIINKINKYVKLEERKKENE